MSSAIVTDGWSLNLFQSVTSVVIAPPRAMSQMTSHLLPIFLAFGRLDALLGTPTNYFTFHPWLGRSQCLLIWFWPVVVQWWFQIPGPVYWTIIFLLLAAGWMNSASLIITPVLPPWRTSWCGASWLKPYTPYIEMFDLGDTKCTSICNVHAFTSSVPYCICLSMHSGVRLLCE